MSINKPSSTTTHPATADRFARIHDELLRRDPTTADLIASFAAATANWAKAGFPVVTEAVYSERAYACLNCPKWDAKARFGLGKCLACGCTRFKRWLATEKCPLGKWMA